jgi:predicted GIY-YIG superfamily endonuclease
MAITYTLYELHFLQPFRHARHYIGVTALPVEERLRRHRSGDGARLLAALLAAGGDFVVTRTEVFKGANARERAFAEERRLKRHHGAGKRCRLCRAERRTGVAGASSAAPEAVPASLPSEIASGSPARRTTRSGDTPA